MRLLHYNGAGNIDASVGGTALLFEPYDAAGKMTHITPDQTAKRLLIPRRGMPIITPLKEGVNSMENADHPKWPIDSAMPAFPTLFTPHQL